MADDVVTWARLRAPIGRGTSFVTLSGGATNFNVTWQGVSGQMFVAVGNSPLRTYRNPFWVGTPAAGGPMFVNNYLGLGSFGENSSIGGTGNVLPDDQISQLVGQTVVVSDGTFTMTSDAFLTGGQSTGTFGTISSVGNLTVV